MNQFDVIVIDSLAGMVAAAEFDEAGDDESGGSFMGVKARIMGQFMRKVVKPLADSGCALVFINQERMNLQPFGKKTFTPGGKAIYLTGNGASPEGDRPFIDRFDLDSREAK